MIAHLNRNVIARGTEYLLSLAVLVLIGRAMWWVYEYGYLPQPFFYQSSDTFMDWFNTAFWAHDEGPYDSWQTIYPPLSFVIIRLLSIPSCYTGLGGGAVTLRDCDWLGLVMIYAIFLLNLVLISLTFLKIDRRTALPRSIALGAGMPMLFALERGNILLLCFTCFLLGFGPLLKSARARWLFAGLAINFKVYLIGAVFAQALRRRWLWMEGALLATAFIYVVSYAILGVGSPAELIANITNYAEGFEASQVVDVWYTVTYRPVISLLEGKNLPITSLTGSTIVDIGLVVLPALMRAGQAMAMAAAIATLIRPEVVPNHRVALLALLFTLISSEAGGYSQIMIVLLVFLESWKGFARPFAIVCSYILCMPGDIITGTIPTLITESYLSGRPVEVHFGVGLGMFVRPGILIFIAFAISSVTIRDVWRDVRLQGWSHRHRYRKDLPLLPGVKRPQPE